MKQKKMKKNYTNDSIYSSIVIKYNSWRHSVLGAHNNKPRFLCNGRTNRLYLIKPIMYYANLIIIIYKVNVFALFSFF